MRVSLTQAAIAAAVTVTLSTPASGAAARTPLALAEQTAHRAGTTLATGTGPLSSDNVSLVTTIPGSAAGMRIVGKYAYVTGWSGLTILDVSKPDAPQVVSTLPVAHFENEDVESDGRVVLISNDREQANKGGALYVVDVKDPKAPSLASVLSLSQITSDERGPGHIANCVKDGCRWVWLTGGFRVWVVDLHDIHNPLLVGAFSSPTTAGNSSFGTPGKAGTAPVHDAERDGAGVVWVTGAGGAAAYDVKDPVHPRLLTTTGKAGVDPKVNDFILHNSVRPRKGNTLLVTEEDYIDESEVPPGGCRGQGKFQTWDVRGYEHGKTMGLLDQWLTEVEGVPLLNGSKAPVTVNCSSHWFRERNGIAAVGWYEQGLRLLDVRNPRDIKQVGYWLPPNSVAWAAYWLSNDIVYVADVGRGIDVLRVTGLDKPVPVTAPIRASWLGAGVAPLSFLQPSQRWGYACLLP